MASLALGEALKGEVLAIDQKMRKNILGIEKVALADTDEYQQQGATRYLHQGLQHDRV